MSLGLLRGSFEGVMEGAAYHHLNVRPLAGAGCARCKCLPALGASVEFGNSDGVDGGTGAVFQLSIARP